MPNRIRNVESHLKTMIKCKNEVIEPSKSGESFSKI